MSITASDRFWAKVKPIDNGCWEWQAFKLPGGYGKFKWEGRCALAHRVAYQMENGDIPDGANVLHSCDNPGCVNPAHLFAGTQCDNVADMLAKGRADRRGERNNQSKLTRAEVIAIRSDARSQRKIAADYGVSQRLIWNVKNSACWTHLE